jgi:transcriptional regulator with XRE-family HTH domain
MLKVSYSFPDWINRQFVLWQADQGKRKTIDEFASYIGISRPLLNMWMNGNRKPGTNNIKLLADLFGMEVYDVLDLPRPDPDLHYIQNNWIDLKPEHRKALRETAEKYLVNKKGK